MKWCITATLSILLVAGCLDPGIERNNNEIPMGPDGSWGHSTLAVYEVRGEPGAAVVMGTSPLVFEFEGAPMPERSRLCFVSSIGGSGWPVDQSSIVLLDPSHHAASGGLVPAPLSPDVALGAGEGQVSASATLSNVAAGYEGTTKVPLNDDGRAYAVVGVEDLAHWIAGSLEPEFVMKETGNHPVPMSLTQKQLTDLRCVSRLSEFSGGEIVQLPGVVHASGLSWPLDPGPGVLWFKVQAEDGFSLSLRDQSGAVAAQWSDESQSSPQTVGTSETLCIQGAGDWTLHVESIAGASAEATWVKAGTFSLEPEYFSAMPCDRVIG